MGWVTHVQRQSLHDGPGVRTTLFLQGCNLRCGWCHNPETIPKEPVLLYYSGRCVGCGMCLAACASGALLPGGKGTLLLRERCVSCFACATVCPNQALTPSARKMTLSEALDEARKDRRFFESSGGGVTISGGEPMMQFDFTRLLLKGLREEGIHTALDTAGLQPWERYEALLGDVDLFLIDYKAFSPELHARATGVSGGVIRQNLRKLCGAAKAIRVRVPVIPGVNDQPGELRAMAADLADMGFRGDVELLPFHNLGSAKYTALGRDYAFVDVSPPTEAAMRAYRELFLSYGLCVL